MRMWLMFWLIAVRMAVAGPGLLLSLWLMWESVRLRRRHVKAGRNGDYLVSLTAEVWYIVERILLFTTMLVVGVLQMQHILTRDTYTTGQLVGQGLLLMLTVSSAVFGVYFKFRERSDLNANYMRKHPRVEEDSHG